MTTADDRAFSLATTAEQSQAIQSDYYTLTDEEGWPIAALLVLLDSRRTPVRAELHFYDDLTDQLREQAFRQGRSLLERRYFSQEPVALRVLQSEPLGEIIPVRAQGLPQRPGEGQWYQRWQVAAAAGLLVLLLALIWAVTSFLRGPATTVTNSTTAAEQSQPVAATAAPDDTSSVAANAQPGGLPVSRFADPNLAIGRRVQVRPGLKLSLVSEPGPESSVVGYMENQQSAQIIDGPAMTQGTSDTIVWWRIRLDDGAEAWAPANTSDGPVLALAE
jgi:hypothetical protein